MELKEIAELSEWTLLTNSSSTTISIQEGYAGDLLSDVLANAQPGSVWFTIQRHKNILGVAAAKDLGAIILCGGITPDNGLLQTAEERNLPVYVSEDDTFTAAGKLYTILKKNDFQK